MAKSKTMIDNEKTRVTMWSFEVGEETGQHVHEYDYVIVPMLDGELKIINEDDSISISKLNKGECYFRNKGVNHNVKNNNDFRRRIYVKSGHNASHNRVITLSELCMSYKDLCMNLHTRNHKKHKINFV